jgi:hypothetical protein
MRSVLVAVSALALASCATTGEKPRSSSAPKEKPVAYSRDPYPSTYRAFPGVPTVITNVTIYDGEGGRIDNGQVLFAEGKVVAVGQTVSASTMARSCSRRGRSSRSARPSPLRQAP